MESLSPRALISGAVWVVCGTILLAVKVSIYPSSASPYWGYVGGFLIVFGLFCLFWGSFNG